MRGVQAPAGALQRGVGGAGRGADPLAVEDVFGDLGVHRLDVLAERAGQGVVGAGGPGQAGQVRVAQLGEGDHQFTAGA
ncbi:hypothetical protein ACIPLC_36305 [Kitasatospora sp. NPDC086801]|uniref:hypothetical protein n=1 Tax=Kitasatospora sp. NPDC086801 TaxID=3364066 RepID=UPI0038059760